jgi:hypothetical protein
LRPTFTVVLAIVFWWIFFDALVFRSGLYLRYVEPESTAGSVMRALRLVRPRAPARADVLVLGDSRVAEGFWSEIANASSAQTHLHFIAAGIAGTTPRVWDFFLRTVDPGANRFAAIVLMTTSFSDDSFGGWLSNRGLDLNYLTPLVHLTDAPVLADSFDDLDLKHRVWRQVLLPGEGMQSDVREFLSAPKARLDKVRQWRASYADWLTAYAGHAGQVPPLALVQSGGDQGLVAPAVHQQLIDYIQKLQTASPLAMDQANRAYRSLWYGRIAKRYQRSGVPVLIFLIPRGPYHSQLGSAPALLGSLQTLSQQHLVRVLDPAPSTALEQPKFFFDQLHLNQDGRVIFSNSLTQQVVQALQ